MPARSATVRASLSTRWNARADNCSCDIALRINDVPASSSWQWTRTSAGRMSALQAMAAAPLGANRWRCRSRPTSTRAWTLSEGSPRAALGEAGVVDAGDVDMDVDTVEQGAGDALLIVGDRGGGAGALAGGVAEEAARAGTITK